MTSDNDPEATEPDTGAEPVAAELEATEPDTTEPVAETRGGGDPHYRRKRETPRGRGVTYTGRPY
jgi:hypothetical protein